MIGIKVNEHRMRALGFPVFKYQLASFTLAGSLGGLAGYMAAVQYGFVNPANFKLVRTNSYLN